MSSIVRDLRRHQRSASALGISRSTSELSKRLSGFVSVTDRIPESLSTASRLKWIPPGRKTPDLYKTKRPTTGKSSKSNKRSIQYTDYLKADSFDTRQLGNGLTSGRRLTRKLQSSNQLLSNHSHNKQSMFLIRSKSTPQMKTKCDSNNNRGDDFSANKKVKNTLNDALLEDDTYVTANFSTMTEFHGIIQAFRETRLAQKKQKCRKMKDNILKTEPEKNEIESVFERTAKTLL
ncbi:unnamed protein product, partial [Owenia fusiformis]